MLLWFNPRRENNNQNTKQPIRWLHSLSWRWTCSCLQGQLSGPQQTNHRPTSRKKINAKTQLSLKRQQKGGRSIEPLSCSRWGVFFLAYLHRGDHLPSPLEKMRREQTISSGYFSLTKVQLTGQSGYFSIC